MKILVLRVINSSRQKVLCTGLNSLVVCVKSPHSLVPRSFGFLTQTTGAYNPVGRTFYDVNYIDVIVFAELLAHGIWQVSCDHKLANEWARCSGKNASYVTNIDVILI